MNWLYRAFILSGFLAIRVVYARAGVRFRADTIETFAQFLDPTLLKTRLLESLWVLHSQPPLLNLVAGLALKGSPGEAGTILAWLFWASGLATCWFLAGTFRTLGVSPPLAAILALAFCATPSFLLYENWFFYPHLALTLITGAGYFFLRCGGLPNAWMGAGFGCLGGLVLLRSLFHPVFLGIALVAATIFARRGERRRILLLGAAPTAIVLLIALKNLVLFGFFGTSSWGGNSLHRMMTETLDRTVIEEMVARRELTPISLEWEFSRAEIFVAALAPDRADRGIPALDALEKPGGRQNRVNFNHWIYPVASRVYLRSALHLIRRYPGAYVRSLRWTSRRFFDAVTDDQFLSPNRIWIKKPTLRWAEIETSAVARVLLGVAVLYAMLALFRSSTPRAERFLLLFSLGTALWVFALSVSFEFGENNRFRYQSTGLGFLFLAYAARDLLRYLQAARRTHTPSPTAES